MTAVLRLDLHTRQPEQVAPTDDVRTTIVDQCTAVHKTAQACRVVPTNSLEALEVNHQDHPGIAWLAPIATAIEYQIPLYSDDVALRATARSKGVPSFGTLSLLDALIKTGQDVAPDNTALTTLFDHLVVDLPQAGDLLFTTNNQRDPLSKQALLNLARPAVWQRQPNNTVDMLLTVVSKVPAEDAHDLATLVCACAMGWAAAFTPADEITATLAALVLAFHTGITSESAGIVVPAIERIAEKYEPNANIISSLYERLIDILTDPTGEFQLTTQKADERVDSALQQFK